MSRVTIIFNIVRRHCWVAHLMMMMMMMMMMLMMIMMISISAKGTKPQVKVEVQVCVTYNDGIYCCCYPIIDNCVNRHCNAVTGKNLQDKVLVSKIITGGVVRVGSA